MVQGVKGGRESCLSVVKDVSVIIPSHSFPSACFPVLQRILEQSVMPKEVLLVRVSATLGEERGYWRAFSDDFAQKGVTLKVVEAKSLLFPGAARNLGLQHATKQWVAFLDVETIPCEHWLSEQTKRIEAADAMGSFGSTVYAASSVKQALVRDAVYGRRPIPT